MSCIVMSCNFLSCIFTPCNLVRQFHVRHFQSTPNMMIGRLTDFSANDHISFSRPDFKKTIKNKQTLHKQQTAVKLQKKSSANCINQHILHLTLLQLLSANIINSANSGVPVKCLQTSPCLNGNNETTNTQQLKMLFLVASHVQ